MKIIAIQKRRSLGAVFCFNGVEVFDEIASLIRSEGGGEVVYFAEEFVGEIGRGRGVTDECA